MQREKLCEKEGEGNKREREGEGERQRKIQGDREDGAPERKDFL